ncbi:hypothetical protein CC2G_000987 [Coprinopsis cinerea AmutBmut pab1-1]|nr:hypothetical protein CC2G_000987 [Coprinopsis cinerea AmutBmut pab1-1]
MSEIDDIFASKGKAKQIVTEHPKDLSDPSSSKKKKKKSKDKSKPDPAPANQPKEKESSKKRPAPETIVDPSQQVASAKRHKPNTALDGDGKKSKKKKVDKEEEEKFKDSRGTSGRRTTEEGWTIYNEDELGISHEGGDTPLCPFDCDCCF